MLYTSFHSLIDHNIYELSFKKLNEIRVMSYADARKEKRERKRSKKAANKLNLYKYAYIHIYFWEK